MRNVKQILVVDDHFEMLEFLRSMLEQSSDEYQVLGVPSAEEGLLELKRTPFDLLITDVRLPGMSGFDLVRQVMAVRPGIPIIIITGYSSEQGEQEADDLGVVQYFKKPLNTEALLAAVHTSLSSGEVVKTPPATTLDTRIPYVARKRLDTLRSDTGARLVVLIESNGKLLYASGSSGEKLDLNQLASGIAEAMAGNFRLAENLGSEEPFTIQYQAGLLYDLYTANVGRQFIVAIFFDAQTRRGRIGTIWVFAQRAISDLIGLLDGVSIEIERAGTPVLTDDEQVQSAVQPESMVKEIDAPAPGPSRHEPLTANETENELEKGKEGEEDAGEQPAAEPMSLAEMQTLLGVEAPEAGDDVDLDSFWEDALASELDGNEGNMSGLSLDEARKQGLIPSEFDDKKTSQ